MDTVKLALALFIAVVAVALFYVYAEQPALFRVGGLLIAASIAVAIVLQTDKGRYLWSGLQGAQVEVRKVIWPTRQETTQTTLIVVIVVILVAILLWLLDMFLGWSVGALIR